MALDVSELAIVSCDGRVRRAIGCARAGDVSGCAVTQSTLGTLFVALCDDATWHTHLTDTLVNECLNFAHRVLAYVDHEHRDDSAEERERALGDAARALRDGFGAFNNGMGAARDAPL
jgi:hypothetical protein